MAKFTLALVNELGSGLLWIINRVWAWGIPVFLYGLGVNAMFGDQYLVASGLYFAAVLVAAIKTGIEAKSDSNKAGTFFVLVAGSVVVFVLSIFWVKHTHDVLARTDATPQIIAWFSAHSIYFRSLPGRWILGGLIVGFVLSSIINVKRRQPIETNHNEATLTESERDAIEAAHAEAVSGFKFRIENLEQQVKDDVLQIRAHEDTRRALDRDLQIRDREIGQCRNGLAERERTIDEQSNELVAIRTSLEVARIQLDEHEETLELARREDQRHREREAAMQTEIGNLKQVRDGLQNAQAELMAETNKLREQLEPKVKLSVKPTHGSTLPAPSSPLMHPPPYWIELDIEVENLTDTAITHFKVEVVGISHPYSPHLTQHLSPIVILPQKEGAESDVRAGTLAARGRAIFSLARKAEDEPSLKLVGTGDKDVTITQSAQGIDVVLVAGGSNTVPLTNRVRITGYRMRIGYANYRVLED